MKRFILILAAAVLSLNTLSAQKIRKEFRDCDSDIKAGIGYCANLHRGKDLAPGSSFYYLDYGRFASNGLGGRVGFTFAPEMDGIEYCYGMPLAFAFRSTLRQSEDVFHESSFNEDRDYWEYYEMHPDRNPFIDMAAEYVMGALAYLMTRGEFFVGITPGIVAGNDNLHTLYRDNKPQTVSAGGTSGGRTKYREGIITNHRFSCSADFGASVSWRIWRFTLDFTPAVHYLFTDNFRQYSSLEPAPDSPIRWHITLAGGLSFNF